MVRIMLVRLCWFFVIVVLKDRLVQLQREPARCDRSRRAAPREGVLGSVRTFPWLGVLRVHLHQEATLKIALTGIVLVKQKYAIANADDIARIPKRVFQEDSRAMFIPHEYKPWFCTPLDYLTHPEYETETLNSIALIELQPPPDADFPMKPVCPPPYFYNITNDLYAVGYTDDNQFLEKFIHELKYVDQKLCKEFYTRAGLSEGIRAPVHFECGFAHSNKDSCVWDNGMALVSNSSEYWVLIGLGLQGPGCAAPARFLSLSHYYPWIESATNLEEIEDQGNSRRSAFGIGFKKQNGSSHFEYIPAHELLRFKNEDGRKQEETKEPYHQKHDFAHFYPMDTEKNSPFEISRISGTEIQIKRLKNTPYRIGHYGNCNDDANRLIYKDYIRISARETPYFLPKLGITVRYLMSLHDSLFLNYTCVTIKLLVNQALPAYLHYDTTILNTPSFLEDLDEIIRVYPFHTQTRLVQKHKLSHLVKDPIKPERKKVGAYHVHLYLKANFYEECRIAVQVYGPPSEIEEPVILAKTTTTKTTTTKTHTTKDPYADLRKNIPLQVFEPEADRQNVSEKEEPVFNNVHAVMSIRMLIWLVIILIFL